MWPHCPDAVLVWVPLALGCPWVNGLLAGLRRDFLTLCCWICFAHYKHLATKSGHKLEPGVSVTWWCMSCLLDYCKGIHKKILGTVFFAKNMSAWVNSEVKTRQAFWFLYFSWRGKLLQSSLRYLVSSRNKSVLHHLARKGSATRWSWLRRSWRTGMWQNSISA